MNELECRHVTKNRSLDFPFVFLEEMTYKSLIDIARMLQSARYRQEYFHQLSDVSDSQVNFHLFEVSLNSRVNI